MEIANLIIKYFVKIFISHMIDSNEHFWRASNTCAHTHTYLTLLQTIFFISRILCAQDDRLISIVLDYSKVLFLLHITYFETLVYDIIHSSYISVFILFLFFLFVYVCVCAYVCVCSSGWVLVREQEKRSAHTRIRPKNNNKQNTNDKHKHNFEVCNLQFLRMPFKRKAF